MKATLLCILLCLLLSLVEVQSQTEYPYISFEGNNLSNHSYVDLSQVGNDFMGSDSDTVQCHTDLSTCCRNSTVETGLLLVMTQDYHSTVEELIFMKIVNIE